MNAIYKNHQKNRESYCGRNRVSIAKKPFNRFVGRHKRLGASSCCHLKQFDVSRAKAYCKFNTRRNVPYTFEVPHTVWGFGVIKSKFLY